MQEKLSDNQTIEHVESSKSFDAAGLTTLQRLLLLAINVLGLIHIIGTFAVYFIPTLSIELRISAALLVLYLVPPIIARCLLILAPIKQHRIKPGSKPYFVWWTLFNLQSVYSRLPFLEELLRLIPGIYSIWLRLWGSKIGRLTYWTSGTTILDRSFLQIGDDVIFGAGSRLNPHVLIRNDSGELELLLAPVIVGNQAIIGGYSLLTSGTQVADNEVTRAFTISPPFTRWENGKRTKLDTTAAK